MALLIWSKPMRVIFLGNGFDYSLAFLRALSAMEVELVAMVCPTAGGQHSDWASMATSIAARLPATVRRKIPARLTGEFPVQVLRVAQRTGATALWPQTMNDSCLVDELAFMAPDLVVMAGFNEILSDVVLEGLSPIINIHPSVLPAHRGPHPEFWSIAMGGKEGGVTFHLVNDRIDCGPIVAQERFPIEPWLTGGGLQLRAIEVGCRLLAGLLEDLDVHSIPSWPQEGPGSYQGKVRSADLVVRFREPASRAHDFVRAAHPWLHVRTYVPKDWWYRASHYTDTASAAEFASPDFLRLDLRNATVFPDFELGAPGIVRRVETGGIAIACKPGTVFCSSATPVVE